MRNIDFNLIACLSREYSCLLIMLIFEINIVLLRIFMSYAKPVDYNTISLHLKTLTINSTKQMRTANLLSKTTAFAVLMLCVLTSKATIWRVNNNPNYTQGCNHCFGSLQVANDTSIVMAGDTIHLEASQTPYVGSGTGGDVILNKRIVILGPGYFLSQNPDEQKNSTSAVVVSIVFNPGSEFSILKGVEIATTSTPDIQINTSNILIESCKVDRFIDFRATTGSPTTSNIVIKKCYVSRLNNSNNNSPAITNLNISNSYFYQSFTLTGTPTSGNVTHCYISNDGSSANWIDITNTIDFINNIVNRTSGVSSLNQNNNGINNVHDNIFIPSPPTWLVGGNNHTETYLTVFPSTGSPDSILNVNPIGICPVCYTAFPGNATFGMYGGADPYRLSGIPNIPAIYQLASPLNASQGSTINVNISTRSND